MEQVYLENEGLVKKVANRFATSYGVEFEEAFAEAQFAFVKYYENYDAAKSALSTYMWRSMWGHMQTWYKDFNSAVTAELNEEIHSVKEVDEFSLDGLSETASYMVDMVLGDTLDLIPSQLSACTTRKVIKDTLHNLGISKKAIWAASVELKERFA